MGTAGKPPSSLTVMQACSVSLCGLFVLLNPAVRLCSSVSPMTVFIVSTLNGHVKQQNQKVKGQKPYDKPRHRNKDSLIY